MMYEAYMDRVMRCRLVFHWHKQFREGRTSSLAAKRTGRPMSISTDGTINNIVTLITDDGSHTQLKIAAHLHVVKGMVQKMLKNCLMVCCS